jgi:hypothetical protein
MKSVNNQIRRYIDGMCWHEITKTVNFLDYGELFAQISNQIWTQIMRPIYNQVKEDSNGVN